MLWLSGLFFFSCSTAPVYGIYPGSQGCAFIFNFSIQAAREETARLDVTVRYLQEELANRRFVACFCWHNQDQSVLFLLWHSFIHYQKIRYRYYPKHYVVKEKFSRFEMNILVPFPRFFEKISQIYRVPRAEDFFWVTFFAYLAKANVMCFLKKIRVIYHHMFELRFMYREALNSEGPTDLVFLIFFS